MHPNKTLRFEYVFCTVFHSKYTALYINIEGCLMGFSLSGYDLMVHDVLMFQSKPVYREFKSLKFLMSSFLPTFTHKICKQL